MVSGIAPLVAGILVGYWLDKDGRRLMVVCPPGQTPPADIQPISYLPPSGPLPPRVQEAYILEPISARLVEVAPYGISTTYYMEHLLDARLAAKVLLVVDNGCGTTLTVQVVGHTQDTPTESGGLVNIGGTQTIAADGGRLGFGIDLTTDWYPYLGVTILSPSTPPTTGLVTVWAYGQRWRNIAQQQV